MRLAIACLIAVAWASQLPAQDTIATTAPSGPEQEEGPRKDPQRARVLGTLFPGAGHVYVGEYWHASRVYFTTISLIGGGYMMYLMDDCLFSWASTTPCEPGPQWPHRALGIAAIGAGFGAWIWGARDAGRRAERMNRNYGRRVTGSPLIEPSLSGGGGARVGLTLHW